MLHVLLNVKLLWHRTWNDYLSLYISIVVNEELREDAKLKSVVLSGMLYCKRLTLWSFKSFSLQWFVKAIN